MVFLSVQPVLENAFFNLESSIKSRKHITFKHRAVYIDICYLQLKMPDKFKSSIKSKSRHIQKKIEADKKLCFRQNQSIKSRKHITSKHKAVKRECCFFSVTIVRKGSLCFQTSTNSHWRSCLKMSHTQDMVMITLAISLEIFEGELLVFVTQNYFKVSNSTCVQITADTNISQE